MPVKHTRAWREAHDDVSTLVAAKRGGRAAKTARGASAPPLIDKSMQVGRIVTLCPEATAIMNEYGLHCFNCSFSTLESLEEGCLGHGMTDGDIDNLVTDINEHIAASPPKPVMLTITREAARAIQAVTSGQKKEGYVLTVIADEHGGFCMEFSLKPNEDDKSFAAPGYPSVNIFASAATLGRIGGSTIDFRDGRFKLDLDAPAVCSCGGECSCHN